MPSSWFISSFVMAKDCLLLFFFFFFPARWPFLFLGALFEGPAGGSDGGILRLDPGFADAILGKSAGEAKGAG